MGMIRSPSMNIFVRYTTITMDNMAINMIISEWKIHYSISPIYNRKPKRNTTTNTTDNPVMTTNQQRNTNTNIRTVADITIMDITITIIMDITITMIMDITMKVRRTTAGMLVWGCRRLFCMHYVVLYLCS